MTKRYGKKRRNGEGIGKDAEKLSHSELRYGPNRSEPSPIRRLLVEKEERQLVEKQFYLYIYI